MFIQKFLTLLCGFFCLGQAFAQTSIGLETGFGWQWAADNTLGGSYRATNSIYESSIKARSLGQGSSYGLYLAHALNNTFDLELGLSYLYGAVQRKHSYAPEANTDVTYQATMFSITPSLKWKVATQKHFRYFFRIGGGIGIGGGIKYGVQSASNTAGLYVSELVYSGGLAYHLTGGMGVEYQKSAASKFRFFTEMRLYSGNYSPNKGALTKEKQGEVDLLALKPVNEKQAIYKSTIRPNEVMPPNKPATALRQYYPLSSFGLYAGCYYQLSSN